MNDHNTPDTRLPAGSHDLIRFLRDELRPDIGGPIRKDESLEDAHRRAGQVELIDELVGMMAEELEEDA